MKVLIVEDAKAVNKLVAQMMSSEGYDISCCYSAEEAVEILKEKSFDFIVTDLIMPGMDGVELIEYIRDNITSEERPFIVAMSGGSKDTVNAQTAIQSVEGLVDGVLSKPFSKKTLVDEMFNISNKS